MKCGRIAKLTIVMGGVTKSIAKVQLIFRQRPLKRK